MYDDELQNINWHFAGQQNWEKSKKCNTCKKNPDWYYCGDYLGALDVYTGEHYEDIFEKINNIIENTECSQQVIVNVNSVERFNEIITEDTIINIIE